MPTPTPDYVIAAQAVAAILLALIFQSTLEPFLDDYKKASSLLEYLKQALTADFHTTARLFIFLVLLARFYWGAYRFLQELPDPDVLGIFMHSLGNFLLFVLFYATSKTVKRTELFYQTVIGLHLIDVMWFAGTYKLINDAYLQHVAGLYLVFDALTIGPMLIILFFRRWWPDWIGYAALPAVLLGVSGLDYALLHGFYFGERPRETTPVAEEGVAQETMTAQVYLAGPLFSQSETSWNRDVAEELTARHYSVILPQETAKTFVTEFSLHGTGIFERNRRDIESADVVVAILDGADVDSGTAWEVGYAYALEKPVIGVRTDFRNSGDAADKPVNLMISESIAEIVLAQAETSLGDLVSQVDQAVRRASKGSR